MARPEVVEWLLLSFECNLQTLKHAECGVAPRHGSKIMEIMQISRGHYSKEEMKRG